MRALVDDIIFDKKGKLRLRRGKEGKINEKIKSHEEIRIV